MTDNGFGLHRIQIPGRRIGSIRRPRTLLEALRILEADAHARPISGGTDLLLDLQRGAGHSLPPVTLVDLTTIAGFRGIDETAE